MGANGEIDISHEQGSIISVGNPELADRLDAFLQDPRALQVSAWQVEWLPALVGGAFLLVPALVLLSLIAQFVRFVTRRKPSPMRSQGRPM